MCQLNVDIDCAVIENKTVMTSNKNERPKRMGSANENGHGKYPSDKRIHSVTVWIVDCPQEIVLKIDQPLI